MRNASGGYKSVKCSSHASLPKAFRGTHMRLKRECEPRTCQPFNHGTTICAAGKRTNFAAHMAP
eukprot:scaffold23058_cov20-Tisochrysis_lutea.AAC.2